MLDDGDDDVDDVVYDNGIVVTVKCE